MRWQEEEEDDKILMVPATLLRRSGAERQPKPSSCSRAGDARAQLQDHQTEERLRWTK